MYGPNVTIAPSSDDIESLHVAVEHNKIHHESSLLPRHQTIASDLNESSPDTAMFCSSPVLYPPSSSPPALTHKPKRKLFQTFAREPAPKKPRIIGGFEIEEDSDDADENEIPLTKGSFAREPTPLESVAAEYESLHRSTSLRHGDHDRDLSQQRETRAIPSSPSLPPAPFTSRNRLTKRTVEIRTCAGQTFSIPVRTKEAGKSYEEIIAQRSTTAAGRAKTAYYGIDIHKLIDEAKIQKELDEAAKEVVQEQEPVQSVEQQPTSKVQRGSQKPQLYQMWTEKYRAKKFTDLVGDERTHRAVLHWLKAWDPVVFPGNARVKPKRIYEDRTASHDRQHRKILLLTGPPGLGKTTLAHVCARQAGYAVLEINASDDRSRDVVRGRIKSALGTDTVRGVHEQGKARRAGRPQCVVVDEVDGVVTGSGGSGGEGGFMKALIDLVQLDTKNSNKQQGQSKKGDNFRLMRPLIMICNDVYAPALRPLRASGLAEIIHVRKPSLEKVISRLQMIFEREHIICDNGAVRRLCESSWGLGPRKQNGIGSRGAGEGDIRGVLVQGELAAQKLRGLPAEECKLTRKWVEANMGTSAAGQRGLGRGGTREVVERIFLEGAGMPDLPVTLSSDEARLVKESNTTPIGVADLRKRSAITALRGMVDTCGEHDRLMTECFSQYPTQVFQDDTMLSNVNAGYDWLHFHDKLSSRIHSGQEWELGAYLSTGACGFHDLFAAVGRSTKSWHDEKMQTGDADAGGHPFSGFKADFAAYEAEKQNRATLTEMQSSFAAPLLRLFSSVDAIAAELVPNISRMFAPDIKPVVIGAGGGSMGTASVRKDSEKGCVKTVVRAMHGLGVNFEKIRIEHEGGGAHSNGGFALRMEPPIDNLNTFHFTKSVGPSSSSTSSTTKFQTATTPQATAPAPVRYAIRSVLAQELAKEKILQASLARRARGTASNGHDINPDDDSNNIDGNKENQAPQINRSKNSLAASIARSTSTLTTTNPATVVPQVKKDFFGRPIIAIATATATATPGLPVSSASASSSSLSTTVTATQPKGSPDLTTGEQHHQPKTRTWVSFHEGYSNAVRKYLSLNEFLDGF